MMLGIALRLRGMRRFLGHRGRFCDGITTLDKGGKVGICHDCATNKASRNRVATSKKQQHRNHPLSKSHVISHILLLLSPTSTLSPSRLRITRHLIYSLTSSTTPLKSSIGSSICSLLSAFHTLSALFSAITCT